jgi:hypothetical protein
MALRSSIRLLEERCVTTAAKLEKNKKKKEEDAGYPSLCVVCLIVWVLVGYRVCVSVCVCVQE